jgi:hypothetical protein
MPRRITLPASIRTRPTESQLDAAIKRVVHLTDIRAIEKAGKRALLESARLDGVRAERAALQRTIDAFAVEPVYMMTWDGIEDRWLGTAADMHRDWDRTNLFFEGLDWHCPDTAAPFDVPLDRVLKQLCPGDRALSDNCTVARLH